MILKQANLGTFDLGTSITVTAGLETGNSETADSLNANLGTADRETALPWTDYPGRLILKKLDNHRKAYLDLRTLDEIMPLEQLISEHLILGTADLWKLDLTIYDPETTDLGAYDPGTANLWTFHTRRTFSGMWSWNSWY
jgi:hypothetical protein